MKKHKNLLFIMVFAFSLAGCKEHTHVFGEWTGVDDNVHERVCSCGEKETAEHDWDDGILVKEPTCTEDGEEKYVCTICGYEKLVSIDATGHELVLQNDSEYHWYGCSHDDCDYIEGKEAHNFVTSEDGMTEVCSVCHYSHTLIYRLDITHEDKFVVGQKIDFTYTATWSDDAKMQVEGLAYSINNVSYASYRTGDTTLPDTALGKEVYVHLYLSFLDGSEITIDDVFDKVVVFYNGVQMLGSSSMTLHSKKCPHYQVGRAQWGDNIPVVTES